LGDNDHHAAFEDALVAELKIKQLERVIASATVIEGAGPFAGDARVPDGPGAAWRPSGRHGERAVPERSRAFARGAERHAARRAPRVVQCLRPRLPQGVNDYGSTSPRRIA
jgi:hypothetical protein